MRCLTVLTLASLLIGPFSCEAGNFFNFGAKKAEEELKDKPQTNSQDSTSAKQESESLSPLKEGMTVVEFVGNNQTFSTFFNALQLTDLSEVLKLKGPFTILVPNNEAFKKLPPGALAKLLLPENREKLIDVLKSHMIAGAITSKELKNGKIKTLSGKELEVKVEGQNVTIDGANVTRLDIVAANGSLIVIDSVITAP